MGPSRIKLQRRRTDLVNLPFRDDAHPHSTKHAVSSSSFKPKKKTFFFISVPAPILNKRIESFSVLSSSPFSARISKIHHRRRSPCRTERRTPTTQPRGGSGASGASGGVGGDRLWWLVFLVFFCVCLGWANVIGLG
ncbi:hypothetical protein ES332_A07G096900v1 [Gossypium tomentosum]|uniref:Uncharacterized protein n=1 Tax=Gossypium tomentosum TaxID=34277 RepID=A0A5D2PQA5_GOSTO|nr:hypothetical protein ES332_A07G096900v1 [Gossypium tomentosum]